MLKLGYLEQGIALAKPDAGRFCRSGRGQEGMALCNQRNKTGCTSGEIWQVFKIFLNMRIQGCLGCIFQSRWF